MNNSFLLPFDKAAKEVTQIDYLSINTQCLVPFPIAANAEQQENSKRVAFRSFTDLLPEDITSKPVQLILFLDKSQIQTCNRGIFYFEDETILPVRFAASSALNTWRTELLRNSHGTFYFIMNAQNCKGHVCDETSFTKHPFDEMGKWIYKLAPKEYKSSGDSKLKATFMAEYKKLDVPQATIDLEKLGEQWRSLLTSAHLKVNQDVCGQAMYEAFENETGLTFPEELKVMLGISNGIEAFLNNTEFLSASKVLEEWKNWKAIYQTSNFMDLVDEYQHKNISEKTVPMYVNPYRIPFVHDGGGNFIGIDMLPNRAGKIGQIIAFGVDEMAIRCIATDMNDFLQQFLDGENPMENDKLAKRIAIGM